MKVCAWRGCVEVYVCVEMCVKRGVYLEVCGELGLYVNKVDVWGLCWQMITIV